MERKLATIRQIDKITPIEGADAIESAHLGGWIVVVKKNEFRESDKVVYFEIDSFIPHEIAPFLTREGYEPKEYEGVRGERLRTVRLRGQISQGLVLDPHKLFNHEFALGLQIGDDVTESLGILKYEPPLPANLAGNIKGNFPSGISKTDQERIQNLSDYPEKYRYEEFEISEKEDGSSCTVFRKDEEQGVCSRNYELKETQGNTFWDTVRSLKILEKLEIYGKNISLQGELVGEGIQKNRGKYKGHHFKLFDIFDIDKKRYMTPEERLNTLKELNAIDGIEIPHVPLLGYTNLDNLTVADLLKMAEGKSVISGSEREGLVFKSKNLINNQVLSFKSISNKYLLKNEE